MICRLLHHLGLAVLVSVASVTPIPPLRELTTLTRESNKEMQNLVRHKNHGFGSVTFILADPDHLDTESLENATAKNLSIELLIIG